MGSLLVSFYLGGYISSLLTARSQGKFSLSGSFYLLLWPLYGIVTITELINDHSDTLISIGKAFIKVIVRIFKWFVGLFKS